MFKITLSKRERDALRDACACLAELAKHNETEPHQNIWQGLVDHLDSAVKST